MNLLGYKMNCLSIVKHMFRMGASYMDIEEYLPLLNWIETSDHSSYVGSIEDIHTLVSLLYLMVSECGEKYISIINKFIEEYSGFPTYETKFKHTEVADLDTVLNCSISSLGIEYFTTAMKYEELKFPPQFRRVDLYLLIGIILSEDVCLYNFIVNTKIDLEHIFELVDYFDISLDANIAYTIATLLADEAEGAKKEYWLDEAKSYGCVKDSSSDFDEFNSFDTDILDNSVLIIKNKYISSDDSSNSWNEWGDRRLYKSFSDSDDVWEYF